MDILEKIYRTKTHEINIRKSGGGKFFSAIATSKKKPSLIAEIKCASPSEGIIRQDFNPVALANIYKKSAAAISVLTDEKYFKGNIEFIKQIKANVDIPILRKDFIFDEYQIYETKCAGANAILFIMALFEKAGISIEKVKALYECAKSIGLDVVVEVHNKEEIDAALYLEPEIIGINVRNLKDFSINLEMLPELIMHLKSRLNKNEMPLIIAESGIQKAEDMKFIKPLVDAVLIGSALMKSRDINSKIKELYSQK